MALNITTQISPNRSAGRGGTRVDRVIYHHTGGGFNGALNWTMNPASQVSYHYMINRDGRIWRTVQEQDTAWHAAANNRRSIGICGETNGWTPQARDAFVALTRDVCGRWGIPINRSAILGHNQVMSTVCPGSLPINDWVALAARPPGPPPPPPPPPARMQGGTELIVQHPTDPNRLDLLTVGERGQVFHRWTTDGSGMWSFWRGEGFYTNNEGGVIAAGTLAASWDLAGNVLNVVGVSHADRDGAPDNCAGVWGMLLFRDPSQAPPNVHGVWNRMAGVWGYLPSAV